MNLCASCGEDFGSLEAFDKHILSKPGDVDFDCMQVEEILRAPEIFTKNKRGQWSLTKSLEQVRKLNDKSK